MRFVSVYPDAIILERQRLQEGVCHVRYQLHRLRACGVLLSWNDYRESAFDTLPNVI